jgi:hypothetical protein
MNFKNKNIFISYKFGCFHSFGGSLCQSYYFGETTFATRHCTIQRWCKRTLDYRANNGKETYWSDAMFGGMPTYQTGAQFRGDVIKKIDDVFNFLPKPANFIFLLFAGFFLLGYVVPKIGNMHFSALLFSDFYLFLYYYCSWS